MGTWTCSKCGKKWEDDEEDCERSDGKPVCSDCHYDAIGELIDEDPLGLPRAPRHGQLKIERPA